MTPLEQFRRALVERDIIPPDIIETDGKLHRCDAEGKHGKGDAAYLLHVDGIAAGGMENHRDGRGWENWRAEIGRTLSPIEQAEHRAKIDRARRERDEEQERQRSGAAFRAEIEWKKAKPAPGDHPYLQRKGIKPHGARSLGRDLVVALRNTKGKIQTLQTITAKGEKRYLAGGSVRGNFYAVGKPAGVLCIAEGFATAGSIHEATGHAVAVAFDCGNLLPVATALRAKYPSLKIVICADDDIGTDGNPGRTKATEAATAVGGVVALPDFGSTRPEGATDFNDLAATLGPDAVRKCIRAAEALAEPVEVVRLVRACEITPVPISWLWLHWLALGKLHILAGPPGAGKSTIGVALAATVTSGGRWPDGSRSEPGNVLIWSGEDDAADTLLPRLIAAGADTSRVWFVTGANEDGRERPFDPARDLVQLTAQAERIGGVKLLIVDPVVSAVAGDSHKNTEVRRALQPVVDLASHLHAAALGISHFSKFTGGRDPTERVTGSVAFAAVARVVLAAAKVKSEDGHRRILCRAKSNIGPDEGGFEYALEQVEARPGIPASLVMWGDALDGSARELLADAEDDDEQQSARGGAEDFLRELLKDGMAPAKTVKSEAAEAGHAWITVRRAADDLGVQRRKSAEAWYWSLPAKVLTNAAKVLTPKHEHLEHVEHLPYEKTAEDSLKTVSTMSTLAMPRNDVQGAQGAHEESGAFGRPVIGKTLKVLKVLTEKGEHVEKFGEQVEAGGPASEVFGK